MPYVWVYIFISVFETIFKVNLLGELTPILSAVIFLRKKSGGTDGFLNQPVSAFRKKRRG